MIDKIGYVFCHTLDIVLLLAFTLGVKFISVSGVFFFAAIDISKYSYQQLGSSERNHHDFIEYVVVVVVVVVIADKQRLPRNTPDDTEELDVVRARWLPVECRQLRGGGRGHKVALARSLRSYQSKLSSNILNHSSLKKKTNFRPRVAPAVSNVIELCSFQKYVLPTFCSFLMLFKNSGLTCARGLN